MLRRLTDRGDGGDDFTQLQLVQNGGLSCGVKSDHQNSHLLLPPYLIEQSREGETHGGGSERDLETVALRDTTRQLKDS